MADTAEEKKEKLKGFFDKLKSGVSSAVSSAKENVANATASQYVKAPSSNKPSYSFSEYAKGNEPSSVVVNTPENAGVVAKWAQPEEKKDAVAQGGAVAPGVEIKDPTQTASSETPGVEIKDPTATTAPTDVNYPAPVDDTAVNQASADYIKSLADILDREPLLTREEREKRERAATAVGGIGALGNVASAFSNLIWTGKGAPSQKLPDNADASKAIDKLREDERAKMKNFIDVAGKKNAEIKAQYQMQQNARDRMIAEQRQQIKDKQDAELSALKNQSEAYNVEYYKARADLEQARADGKITENDYLLKKQELDTRLKEAQIASANSRVVANQAAAGASNARAETSRTAAAFNRAKTAKLNVNENVRGTDGAIYGVNTGNIGAYNSDQLYNLGLESLPSAQRRAVEMVVRGGGNKATDMKKAVISAGMKNNPDVLDEAVNLGVATKVKDRERAHKRKKKK